MAIWLGTKSGIASKLQGLVHRRHVLPWQYSAVHLHKDILIIVEDMLDMPHFELHLLEVSRHTAGGISYGLKAKSLKLGHSQQHFVIQGHS